MDFQVLIHKDGTVSFEFGRTESLDELWKRLDLASPATLRRLLDDSGVGADVTGSMNAVCAIAAVLAKSTRHSPDVTHTLELLAASAQIVMLLDTMERYGAIQESRFTEAVRAARRVLDGNAARGHRDISIAHGVWAAELLAHVDQQRETFRLATPAEQARIVEELQSFAFSRTGWRPPADKTLAALAAEAPRRGRPRKPATRRHKPSPPSRDAAICAFLRSVRMYTTVQGLQKLRERRRKKTDTHRR